MGTTHLVLLDVKLRCQGDSLSLTSNKLMLVHITCPFDQDCISIYVCKQRSWVQLIWSCMLSSSVVKDICLKSRTRSELDIKHSIIVLDVKLRSLLASKYHQMSWPNEAAASIFDHHQSYTYTSTIEWLFNECTFAIWSTKVNF